MERKKVQSLILPNTTYDLLIDTDTAVGSGRQGTVYPLAASNGLVKMYSDAHAKSHMVPLVSYLMANRLSEASESLQGLPLDAFETDDRNVGLLMLRAPGESLGRERYGLLSPLSLPRRLSMALSLAHGVAALHHHDVVMADLAEANLLFDCANSMLSIIDVDGGGIMRHGGYRLRPSVRGHDQGSLIPIEVRHGYTLPNLESDTWSLAVLIHRLLSAPAGGDPFCYGRDYRILEGKESWPIPRDLLDGSAIQNLEQLNKGLALLGPRLIGLFKQTFSRGGRHHPHERTTASRWVQALTVAQHWVHVCGCCGSEFVAEKQQVCPGCGTDVPHATIHSGKQSIPLWQGVHDFSLHRLGLGRSRARAFCIQRKYNQLQVTISQGELQIGKRRRRQIGPGEQVQLKTGKHHCRYRSADRQEVDFGLTVPKGQWPTIQ